MDLAGVAIAPAVLALVPAAEARRHRLIPLALDGACLQVAVDDPLATDGLDALAGRLGLAIEPRLADPAELNAAIGRHYGEALSGVPSAEPDTAVRWFDDVLRTAIARRASDLHLESLPDGLRARFRVDGRLEPGPTAPGALRLPIANRVRVLAGLPIDERRVPQDGRLRQAFLDHAEVELRVSIVPAIHGDSIALRRLDRDEVPDLQSLGWSDRARTEIETLLERPDGLVLIAGPTGSGKSTTLYALLRRLNRADRKIITVEDPIEATLPCVNQVPVRPELGLTFAHALRAMLRQAPNVIMVGEIRDRETAEIVLQAALTGHLVLSTVHAEDAAAAVTRLVDLGLKPALLASALRAVVAQRLVRTPCPRCRRKAVPSDEARAAVAATGLPESAQLTEAVGCPECRGTGYQGRCGVFECAPFHTLLTDTLTRAPDAAELRARLRAAGVASLRQDGVRKALAGLTTLAEVMAVTPLDPADA